MEIFLVTSHLKVMEITYLLTSTQKECMTGLLNEDIDQ